MAKATIDGIRKALMRFEEFTGLADFVGLDRDQAIGFKQRLTKTRALDSGKSLSQAMIFSTVRAVQVLFRWLSSGGQMKLASLVFLRLAVFSLTRDRRFCLYLIEIKGNSQHIYKFNHPLSRCGRRISMEKFWLASIATLLGLAVSIPSFAQMHSQGGGMMGGGCPMMNMMGSGMMGQSTMSDRPAHMGAVAEGRLAYLKSELAIAEKQTEAWNGYAKAVRARVAAMQQMHAGMMDAVEKGTAIERMDARIKGMQAMVEAMSALKPATVKLYDALTPEQKKIADDLIGVGCGGI